jgi:ATP-dependent Lon protease
VVEWLGTEPYLRARIDLAPDTVDEDVELDALQRSLREITREVVALSPHLPEEVNKFLGQVEDPRHLLCLVAANVPQGGGGPTDPGRRRPQGQVSPAHRT